MSNPPPLAESTLRQLGRLKQALAPLQDALSLPQVLSLIAIAREPGLSINELADRIGAPQQSASRYAAMLLGRYQDLATDPLIVQTISLSDPRKRALFLTDQGRALIEALAKRLTEDECNEHGGD